MNAITPFESNEILATRFVQTLIAWFPKADPEPAWTKQAIQMLTPYPKAVFVKMHELAQTEFRGFPSIPQLKALATKAAHAATEAKPVKTPRDTERERHALADEVILTQPDGRQAVSEGWWYSLWQHVAIHGNKYDFAHCRKMAGDADKIFAELMAKENPNDLERMLIRIRQTSLGRKAEVATRLGLA